MAPTYTTTTLNALRWLPGSNLASDIDAGFQALAEDVDAKLGARGYGQVLTAETRNNVATGDLATVGPSITVTVPTNALVQVVSEVTFNAASATGYVVLAEDGVAIGGVMHAVGTGSDLTMWSFPDDLPNNTGTALRANTIPVAFPAAAGSHTYKLMYYTASGSVTFKNRKLWVRTLPL